MRLPLRQAFTVNLGYTDFLFNDILFVTIRTHGIDYFIGELATACLFRLSLAFQETFSSFW